MKDRFYCKKHDHFTSKAFGGCIKCHLDGIEQMKVYIGNKKLSLSERIEMFFDSLSVTAEGDSLDEHQMLRYANLSFDLLHEAKRKLDAMEESERV